jgi:hypothetical protein
MELCDKKVNFCLLGSWSPVSHKVCACACAFAGRTKEVEELGATADKGDFADMLARHGTKNAQHLCAVAALLTLSALCLHPQDDQHLLRQSLVCCATLRRRLLKAYPPL